MRPPSRAHNFNCRAEGFGREGSDHLDVGYIGGGRGFCLGLERPCVSFSAGAALTIGDVQYFVAEPVASAIVAAQPIKLSVGLKAQVAASASITSAAYTQAFVAQKSCAAIAIVAPEASMGANSAVSQYKGIAIRVTSDFDGDRLGDTLVLDVLVGMKVIRPEACALFTAK